MVDVIFAMVVNRLPSSLLQACHVTLYRRSGEVRVSGSVPPSHPFYRAMDVFYKNRLEEDLFGRRWNLFSQEGDLVFFDTTTVSSQGAG